MRIILKSAPLYFILFLLVSCSPTQTVTSPESALNGESGRTFVPERPLPYPIDIPSVYTHAIETRTRSTTGEPGENYWQNDAIYQLEAEIEPETHTLYGKGSITYNNNSPYNMDVFVVELAQNLHAEGTPKKEITEITGGISLSVIRAEGQDLEEIDFMQRWMHNESGYILDGTHLYIYPEQVLASRESLELYFEWDFLIPKEGASGRMGRSRDNLYYLGYWYPQISVYDDVYGWFNDPFVGNAEFYHGFADYEMSVTLPAGWLVMGTGEFLNPEETLSEEMYDRYQEASGSDEPIVVAAFDELDRATRSSDSGKLTWKFRAERVPDVAFSATLESQWESARTPVGDLTGDGETDYTRIHTFYRETAPLWQEQTRYSQHAISFFSDYIGIPYPWSHMTSVEGAEIIGGGMEYPMMTLIGDYNQAGATALYGVTAHELAHMWYPMMIYSNERRYTWLDEGFTSYHTNEANIDFFGEEQFDRMDVFSQYLQIAGTDLEGEMMRWSDYHYPGPAYGIASYPKPASVLYALRTVLGEEVFREAYLAVADRWAWKHPYPWDIFRTFEDVSGRDLSWFWRAWYYETWTLDQGIAGVEHIDDAIVVEIRDHGEVPMPVLLSITLENGEVIHETVSEEKWLKGHRTQTVTLQADSPAVRVEIDPDYQLPDVNRGNNVWEQ